jgi:hypothetical protein
MEMINMKKKQGISFYTLTGEIIKRRILPHSIPLECYKCCKELHIGDKVVRKRRKIYHQECYENMFINLPDNLDADEEFYIEFGYYPTSSSITTSSTISTFYE